MSSASREFFIFYFLNNNYIGIFGPVKCEKTRGVHNLYPIPM